MKKNFLSAVILSMILLQGCATTTNQLTKNGGIDKEKVMVKKHLDRIDKVTKIELREIDEILISLVKLQSNVKKDESNLLNKLVINKKKLSNIEKDISFNKGKYDDFVSVETDISIMIRKVENLKLYLLGNIDMNNNDMVELKPYSSVFEMPIDTKTSLVIVPNKMKFNKEIRKELGVDKLVEKINFIKSQKKSKN